MVETKSSKESGCAAFGVGVLVAAVPFNVAMFVLYRSFSPHVSAHAPVPFGNLVHLEVQYATFNRLMPWQMIPATFQHGKPQSKAQASGLILKKGFILTSSHVAMDAILITARRQGDGLGYTANVRVVAYDLHLALLEVKDSRFWLTDDVDLEPSDGAPLPKLGTSVVLAGFPAGADLSISKLHRQVSKLTAGDAGEVSRFQSAPQVVMSLYPDVGNYLTLGPVFSEVGNVLVGFVAGSGFVVPAQSIYRLWTSFLETGTYHDQSPIGVIVRPMESPAMRLYWGLDLDDLGVQVRSVAPNSPLYGKVQKGDLLVAVNGKPIHCSGTVSYTDSQEPGVSLPWGVSLRSAEKVRLAFRKSHLQDTTDAFGGFGYSRGGAYEVVVSSDSSFKAPTQRSIDQQNQGQPKYFMIGGLIWTVFSEELMVQYRFASKGGLDVATLLQATHRWRADPNEEVILLLRIIDHPCNKFYSSPSVRVLSHFNDERVSNMSMFVRKVGAALAQKADFLRFTFMPLDADDTAGGIGDPDIVLATDLCTGVDMQLVRAGIVSRPASADLQQEYMTVLNESFLAGVSMKAGGWSQHVLSSRAKQSSNDQEKTLRSAGFETAVAEAVAEPSASRELPWANVVKLRVVSAPRDFISPWKEQEERTSTCSGVIVDVNQKMILTNSHCVANAKSVYVLREDLVDSMPAAIVEFAQDVDLAWITTNASIFWESNQILPRVSMRHGLPHMYEPIRVVGFPRGGTSVTITKGIVSRVDGQHYPNGLTPAYRSTPNKLPIVQVDAAINAGNSGGPVFDSSGHLVGLAFAYLSTAQKVGYVIPSQLIRNFLFSVKSSAARRWQAQPEIGAVFRGVENEGMRRFLGLETGQSGVQVRSISPFSPLVGSVKKGDVLVKVDGHPITGNGEVSIQIGGRLVALSFDAVVTAKAINEETSMEFLRTNLQQQQHVNVSAIFGPIAPLCARFDDAPLPIKGRERYSAQPTYFVWWGFVWGVLSNPVDTQAGDNAIPWSLRKLAFHRWRSNPDEELVVLLQALPHECTAFYDTSLMRSIQFFNGKPVTNMRELVRLVLAAERAREEFLRFTFHPLFDVDIAGNATDPDIVLKRSICENANSLVRVHNIPSLVSSDLQALVQPEFKKIIAGAHSDQKRSAGSVFLEPAGPHRP